MIDSTWGLLFSGMFIAAGILTFIQFEWQNYRGTLPYPQDIKFARWLSFIFTLIPALLFIACYYHESSVRYVTDTFEIYDKDGAKCVKFNNRDLNLNQRFTKNYNEPTIKLEYGEYSESFRGWIYNTPFAWEIESE